MRIDAVLFNGNIRTLNAQQPQVSAMALAGNRIVTLGDDDDLLELASARARRIDLGGRTVIPGLTDAHLHMEWLSRAMQAVDLFEVPSKQEALNRVAARVTTAADGEWLQGRGWTQDLWAGEFPTAADLDAVAPANPAFFQAKSGHAAWVNSAALRAAGIGSDTPDPEGGEIVRDASGKPTGILLETAIDLVYDVVPQPDAETLADYIQHAQGAMLASGITGVHDFDNPTVLRAVQILRERGDLGLRVVKQINKAWLAPALESGIRSGFGDDWIRFGSLKLFADGALGPRTALMVDPYEGQPQNTGMAVVEPDEMLELISKASAAGLASTVHAIGDLAVRRVLDVFEQVRQQEAERGVPRDQLRHRIEHVQIIHPDDAHRLAELDIIASMQPIHATSDWEVATRYWGKERCEYAYNARMQIDQGVRVAFGSDAPVEPFDPFLGIHAAVTRQRDGRPDGGWYPHLRLTLDEALHGFTMGAAYAAGMENRLGMLAEGYLADLLVLDRDPYAIPPEELAEVRVISTMVDGVWRSGEFA